MAFAPPLRSRNTPQYRSAGDDDADTTQRFAESVHQLIHDRLAIQAAHKAGQNRGDKQREKRVQPEFGRDQDDQQHDQYEITGLRHEPFSDLR